jgi:hypothetical protein
MIDFDPGTAAPTKETGARNGGDLVVETLEALGAKTVFGIPGQHALGLFDAMGRGNLQFVSSRVENNSAFAADGYSRRADLAGRPAGGLCNGRPNGGGGEPDPARRAGCPPQGHAAPAR